MKISIKPNESSMKLAESMKRSVEKKVQRLREYLMQEIEAVEAGKNSLPSLLVFTNWLEEEVFFVKNYPINEATILVTEIESDDIKKAVSRGIDTFVAEKVAHKHDEDFDGEPAIVEHMIQNMKVHIDKYQMAKDSLRLCHMRKWEPDIDRTEYC